MRAKRVVAGRKFVEGEVAVDVGNRHRHRGAKRRDHGAGKRSTAVVTDDTFDSTTQHRADVSEFGSPRWCGLLRESRR